MKEAQISLNEVIQKAQPLIRVSKIKAEKSQTLILSERSPEIFKRSNPEGSPLIKFRVEKSQTLISSVKEAQRSLNEVTQEAQPLVIVSKS